MNSEDENLSARLHYRIYQLMRHGLPTEVSRALEKASIFIGWEEGRQIVILARDQHEAGYIVGYWLEVGNRLGRLIENHFRLVIGIGSPDRYKELWADDLEYIDPHA